MTENEFGTQVLAAAIEVHRELSPDAHQPRRATSPGTSNCLPQRR